MRAVVITGHGGPEVLQVQERPDPPVGSGEVRIAVKAAGINFADTLARTGMYPDSPKVPCVVGYEVAGEVESVGDGVEVFGTASVSKHDAIREQGVDHPIDYRSQDFAEEVRRITGGEGIDVAFDALGPSSFRKDYRLLRPGGRLIMYGASEVQTGERRSVATALRTLAKSPFSSMPWWKGLGVMNENKGVFGLNMLSWWDAEGGLDRVIEPLLPALQTGELKPVVAEAFPFDRAPDAHRFLAERRNIGKVVLVP